MIRFISGDRFEERLQGAVYRYQVGVGPEPEPRGTKDPVVLSLLLRGYVCLRDRNPKQKLPPLGVELRQGAGPKIRSVRMRVPIRWGPAGKICTALLLGVVSIALVVSCGHVAFSQGGTGSRHPLYITTDLNPNGFISSEALGVSGGQQVGVGSTEGDKDHALLWRSSAATVVDLLPSRGIKATATCGGQQVGYGERFSGGGDMRYCGAGAR